MQPLRQGLQFAHRTEILEETVALLAVPQAEDRSKEAVEALIRESAAIGDLDAPPATGEASGPRTDLRQWPTRDPRRVEWSVVSLGWGQILPWPREGQDGVIGVARASAAKPAQPPRQPDTLWQSAAVSGSTRDCPWDTLCVGTGAVAGTVAWGQCIRERHGRHFHLGHGMPIPIPGVFPTGI